MLVPNSILQNRYRVVRKLGEGGMGAVYEAIDQRVSCVVALKETLVGANDEAREAFQREAALLANLRHPSLPKVMDYFGEADGEFLVMEYIAGHDLAELLELRDSPFPQEQVLDWANELLKLLEYLHTREPPIIHRDIKPANLKVTSQGEIFLLDFGLAKGAAGQMATMQTSRSVRGYTPVYAPLEQIHGRGTDPRSDLYALGASLYDLLTGQPPLSAPVRFEAIENDQADPLMPIRELNPQVSVGVAAVVQSAMALRRRNRPAGAAAMRALLEASREPLKELKRNQGLDAARDAAEAALAASQPYRPEGDPSEPRYADKDVQFTVYAPRKIKPEKIYTLLAFAHLSKRRANAAEDEPDPIEEMKEQAARILGSRDADYHDAKEPSSQPVPRGGEITFVPVVQGITFSPSSRNFTWRKSVHREEFDMWASPAFDGQTLTGRLTVFLGSLVIAEVALTISIDSRAMPATERISLDTPQSARRVRQVFASYSHRDEQVVAELAQVAPIFGSRFLLDRTHLEPGEDRREGLQRLIRGADAFQLFWSTNSMRSPEIVNEIKYAASLGRPGFVLPTYWEEPLPRSPAEGLPPPEIEHLHFYRIYPGAISHATFGGLIESGERRAAGSRAPATTVASPEIPPDDSPTGQLVAPTSAPTYDRRAPTLSTMKVPEVPLALPQQAPGQTSMAGSGPPTGVVVCTKCGNRSAEGTKFCGRCGSTDFQDAAVVDSGSSIMIPAVGSSAPPPIYAAAPPAPRRRRMLMPILAGAAMVLFVAIVAPVWYLMRQSQANDTKLASAPPPQSNANSSISTNATANTNSAANTNSTPLASLAPVVPKRVTPPAEFIKFIRDAPAYEEPVEVKEVDLNGDGVPELLVQYERCGSGGCIIHLFRRTANGFQDISGGLLERMFGPLDDDAHGSFAAGPNATDGYLDLKYRFKKAVVGIYPITKKEELTLSFKFDGQKYRVAR